MKQLTVVALALTGLVVALGLEGTAAWSAAQPTPTPTVAPPTPSATAGTPEGGYRNTLRWTTASEVDNFGFDIYRATNKDGPFERVSREPIPGGGTVDEPQNYVFVDDTIDPSQGYYYYIESISIDGIREKFSPVTYVAPKKPGAATPTPTPAATPQPTPTAEPRSAPG